MIQRAKVKKRGEASGGLRFSDAIRSVPCLRDLTAASLKTLHDGARQRTLPRGAILFREGAPCEKVYILASGKVKVFRLSPEGRQQTLWVLGSGDCFCLAPFFHRARYPGTAQCMTDVRILELSGAALLALSRACPGFPGAVATCLCNRLSTMAALLEDLSTQSVRDRLARLLATLADGQGVKIARGVVLYGWTHEELASCVGTVREVASRELKQLERDGLVRLGRRHLLILNSSR
jgi:CRP/FNR family transcriptional regulator